ncbi:MAG: uroporphyrinogen-III C-methyltransferase [Oscillospiraceae bacterium]|nr:uroporphyrinogen-III C-methyltransferase [Oscillospiraceae bacterium]
MNNGKVWLVGTGPGDPELLTLRAKSVLEQAEVVIYDALVGQGVLAMIPVGAKAIDAGKHAGNHSIPQHEMNRIIYEEALAGNRVVRLKGGDPYMFGRGGEEAEYLVERGMPFEVVPGITSPVAVPAYNGIPVTHRDFAASVHFITAHRKKDMPMDINFRAFVEAGGTYVFMMGVSALQDICTGLLEAGMRPDMPAAILSQGTTAGQKKIVATVSTLPGEVERRGIATPAIIVVGEVCALSDKLQWREIMPLFGKKILVTRPRERSSSLTEKLRRLGAEVLELPAIELEPREDNSFLREQIADIGSVSWIVFTSPMGVEVFFREMRSMKKDARSLSGCRFAVLGAGTGRELEKHGCLSDLMPKVYDNEALARELLPLLGAEDKVLIPRAAIGNPVLTEILSESEAVLVDVPVYDTVSREHPWLDTDKLLESGTVDYVTFTSASTVHSFVRSVKEPENLQKTVGVCIGRQTREAAESYQLRTITAEAATIESICECIINHQKAEVE